MEDQSLTRRFFAYMLATFVLAAVIGIVFIVLAAIFGGPSTVQTVCSYNYTSCTTTVR